MFKVSVIVCLVFTAVLASAEIDAEWKAPTQTAVEKAFEQDNFTVEAWAHYNGFKGARALHKTATFLNTGKVRDMGALECDRLRGFGREREDLEETYDLSIVSSLLFLLFNERQTDRQTDRQTEEADTCLRCQTRSERGAKLIRNGRSSLTCTLSPSPIALSCSPFSTTVELKKIT
jgi:hypothetical protein